MELMYYAHFWRLILFENSCGSLSVGMAAKDFGVSKWMQGKWDSCFIEDFTFALVYGWLFHWLGVFNSMTMKLRWCIQTHNDMLE